MVSDADENGGRRERTRDEVLRVRRRVLFEVGELDRRLLEQDLSLFSERGVKDLCGKGVNTLSRTVQKQPTHSA